MENAKVQTSTVKNAFYQKKNNDGAATIAEKLLCVFKNNNIESACHKSYLSPERLKETAPSIAEHFDKMRNANSKDIDKQYLELAAQLRNNPEYEVGILHANDQTALNDFNNEARLSSFVDFQCENEDRLGDKYGTHTKYTYNESALHTSFQRKLPGDESGELAYVLVKKDSKSLAKTIEGLQNQDKLSEQDLVMIYDLYIQTLKLPIHLQNLGIEHRDLHSQNIVVKNQKSGDEGITAVAIDFGQAKERADLKDQLNQGKCGDNSNLSNDINKTLVNEGRNFGDTAKKTFRDFADALIRIFTQKTYTESLSKANKKHHTLEQIADLCKKHHLTDAHKNLTDAYGKLTSALNRYLNDEPTARDPQKFYSDYTEVIQNLSEERNKLNAKMQGAQQALSLSLLNKV